MKTVFEIEGEVDNLLVADGSKCVAIWAWPDAPQPYRELSECAGTGRECFVALVPKDYGHNINFITNSPYFGQSTIDVYTLETGQQVVIGAS